MITMMCRSDFLICFELLICFGFLFCPFFLGFTFLGCACRYVYLSFAF